MADQETLTAQVGIASEVPSEDKAAMRAFLQRGETRLSTMHRIGGSLIGGAGLLVLLPAFLRDAVVNTGQELLLLHDDVVKYLLFTSMALMILLPIYAIYLLIADLVEFYFSHHHPGWDEEIFDFFYPRFVLSAPTLPTDEVSEELRNQIIQQELGSGQRAQSYPFFVVPENKSDRSYFMRILTQTKKTIVPPDRRKHIDETQDVPTSLLVGMGLAGMLDRTLQDEVAKMEISLVRHNVLLRRLVLRYVKAFLVLIPTALVFISLGGFATRSIETQGQLNSVEESTIVAMLIAFSLWAGVGSWAARRPIHWIYSRGDTTLGDNVKGDSHLLKFEFVVAIICIIVLVLQAMILVNNDLSFNFGFDSEFDGWVTVGIVIWALSVLYNISRLYKTGRNVA